MHIKNKKMNDLDSKLLAKPMKILHLLYLYQGLLYLQNLDQSFLIVLMYEHKSIYKHKLYH